MGTALGMDRSGDKFLEGWGGWHAGGGLPFVLHGRVFTRIVEYNTHTQKNAERFNKYNTDTCKDRDEKKTVTATHQLPRVLPQSRPSLLPVGLFWL